MIAVALGALAGLAAAQGAWTARIPVRRTGLVVGRRHRIVLIGLGATVLGLLAPPLPVLAAGGWLVRRHVRQRRTGRAGAVAVRRALPEAVDLLLLATSAGVALPVAHDLVAPHVPAPVGPALENAARAAARGQPRGDALVAELSPLGDHARSLAQVLGDHLRYGVALEPTLDRIGLELRLDRRRQAELEARRVPVRLLGPLVSCILPAFALLTVVPLLAASLQALPT